MLFLSLALSAPALAQDAPPVTFTPHAWYRPRLEAHSGRDGTAGEGAWLAASHRARLGLTLAREDLTLEFQVQDARTWGEETHTLKDYSADGLDVHQANLTWQAMDAFWIKAGRQEVNLHEQRLIGAVGWTQQARSFDGVRVGSAGDVWDVDLGGFVLTESGLDPALAGDAGLVYGRAGWIPESGRVDALVIWETDRATDFDRFTVGAYAKGTRGNLAGRLEAYGQLGTAGGDTIRAAMVGASGTLTVPGELKPKVTLWVDWLSGDADATDGVSTAFAAPYATNHKFYGFADIAAFSQGAWADGRGLVDAALRLSAAPSERTMVAIDAHTFLLPVGDTPFLAEELDAWGKVKLTHGLDAWVGGAVWFPGGSSDVDVWAVAQLQASL